MSPGGRTAALAVSLLLLVSVVAVATPAAAGATGDASARESAENGRTGADTTQDTLVVDADGGAEYERVQPAIDEAADGDTVEVRPGTYEERLWVDANVTLIAPNGATLDGSSFDPNEEGMRIPHGSHVEGFTITDYGTGVEVYTGPSANLTLSSLTIRDNEYEGVRATAGGGNWAITDSLIADNGGNGVVARGASGDWEITDSILENNGNVGVAAAESSGDWTVADTTVGNNGAAGIDAAGTDGNWAIERSTVRDNVGSALAIGVLAGGSSGDWEIADTAVAGHEYGVRADESSGAWTIRGGSVRDNRVSTGQGETGTAVRAVESTGDWSIRNAQVADSIVGVAARGSTGAWTIRGANVSANALGALATDTTGAWRVADSTVTDNDVHGVDATGANPEGDATGNWWGQATGPGPDQCVGNVSCGDPLAESPDPEIDQCTVITRPGTYEVVADLSSDETCIEVRASDVSLDGQGHVITGQDPSAEKIGVYVNGTADRLSNVTVSNLGVSGWGGNPGTAVRFDGVDGAELSDVTVTDGDRGVRLADAAGALVTDVNVTRTGTTAIVVGSGSSGTSVTDTDVHRAGTTPGDAGLLVDAADVTVRNVNAGYSYSANVHLSSGARDVVVADSRFHNSEWHGPAHDRSVTADGASNVTFRNNTVTGNPSTGVHLSQAGSDYRFVGNEVRGNGGHGFAVTYTENVTLRDNVVTGNDGHGVSLGVTNGLARHVVDDNEIRNNERFGVDLGGVTAVTVSANSVERHGDGGVRVGNGASDVDLRDNVVHNAPHSGAVTFPTGIQFDGATDVDVSNDTVVNAWRGIDVNGSADVTVTDAAVYDTGSGTRALTIAGSTGTDVDRLDVGDSSAANTTVSFEGYNVSVAPTASAPANPSSAGIGRSLDAKSTGGSGAYLDLTVHYEPGDVAGVTESALALWVDDGSGWSEVAGSSVDASADTVSANLTSFGTAGAFAGSGSTTPTPTQTTGGSAPTASPTPTGGSGGSGPGFGAGVALAALVAVGLGRRRGA